MDQRLPASFLTKLVYGTALTLVGLYLLSHVGYALILFKQMPRNPNVINPVTASTIVLIAVIVTPAVLSRVWGLMRGTVTLSSYPVTGLTSWMRSIGIALMTLGVLIAVGVFVSLLVTRIGAVALIGAQFQTVLPVGLGLFELSRVIGFERNASED